MRAGYPLWRIRRFKQTSPAQEDNQDDASIRQYSSRNGYPLGSLVENAVEDRSSFLAQPVRYINKDDRVVDDNAHETGKPEERGEGEGVANNQ